MPAAPPCSSSSTGGSGKGRAPAPPAPIVLEDAPIEAWRVYSHPDPRYRGVWLQSKHAEYHLGVPAPVYAPLAEAFAACVWHAVAVHLFVTDVLGVEEPEEEQPGLEALLQMMAGMEVAAGEDGEGPAPVAPLDEAFAVAHAGKLYDLLRDLHMSGSLEFMKDLVRACFFSFPPPPTNGVGPDTWDLF